MAINNFGQANFFARIGRETMMDQIEKNGGEVVSTVTADRQAGYCYRKHDSRSGRNNNSKRHQWWLSFEKPRQGIIIGSMDAGDADFVDVFVESDNNQLGTQAAEYLMDHIGGKGKIIEIINDAGAMTRMRKEALHAVVENIPM